MRAYVTGASGFIGSHVVQVLCEVGWEVGEEFVDLADLDALRRAMGSEKARCQLGHAAAR